MLRKSSKILLSSVKYLYIRFVNSLKVILGVLVFCAGGLLLGFIVDKLEVVVGIFNV